MVPVVGDKRGTGRVPAVPLEAVSVGGLFCFDGETAESQRRYRPQYCIDTHINA
jgi:hypothetical protein